ncbi:hypothetical protein AB0N17_06750 [Streptomyces sp. NPDC051133]|uniref:hypothetical protein n=1 Tax=Streptomyces sp. NPDC051133 TaxID=3155521 RepID=UPI003422AFA6
MAALVYFAKADSTAVRHGSIRYSFGAGPEEMGRQLCLDTVTRSARPVDGEIDYLFLKASRAINASYDARGRWPERGMSAS